MGVPGVPVLIPANASVTDDGHGGFYVYPKGDTDYPPSGHLPPDGYYFDNLERPAEPYDEDDPDPEGNLEDYMLVSDAQIAYHRRVLDELRPLNKAIQVGPCYAALGDANNIPGPNIR